MQHKIFEIACIVLRLLVSVADIYLILSSNIVIYDERVGK